MRLACLHRARLRSTRPVLPHASAEGRAPPCTAALDVIVETVANGDKVTLVNFGTFDSKRREAREGRNPQTNKPMHIPGTCCPGGPVLGCRRKRTATHTRAHARSFDGADVQVRQDVQGDSEGQCEGARLSLSRSRHFVTCDTAWALCVQPLHVRRSTITVHLCTCTCRSVQTLPGAMPS